MNLKTVLENYLANIKKSLPDGERKEGMIIATQDCIVFLISFEEAEQDKMADHLLAKTVCPICRVHYTNENSSACEACQQADGSREICGRCKSNPVAEDSLICKECEEKSLWR